jgi:hypothetical protein
VVRAPCRSGFREPGERGRTIRECMLRFTRAG